MKSFLQPLLGRLLGDARPLASSTKLAEATAVIQRALDGAAAHLPKVPHLGGTLDGLVRDLTPPRPASPTTEGEFSSGIYNAEAGTRHYKLFVPDGAGTAPLPMIVMLHGCTQNPDDFAAGTRMNEHARRGGFIVLYPAQAPRSNSSKCWNWFQPGDQHRGRGEPALLAGLTRQIMTTHAVDPDRIYVAGMSAGGAMAAILGREYAELFAAAGVHSGLPPGAAHDVASAFSVMRNGQSAPSPAEGAPLIVFHGDHDQTVHPANGAQVIGELRAVAAPSQRRGDVGRAYTQNVYRGVDGKVQAEHWLVHGAGHAWSGGDPAGSYTDARGPDASAEMVRFFLEHPRRPARTGASASASVD